MAEGCHENTAGLLCIIGITPISYFINKTKYEPQRNKKQSVQFYGKYQKVGSNGCPAMLRADEEKYNSLAGYVWKADNFAFVCVFLVVQCLMRTY